MTTNARETRLVPFPERPAGRVGGRVSGRFRKNTNLDKYI